MYVVLRFYVRDWQAKRAHVIVTVTMRICDLVEARKLNLPLDKVSCWKLQQNIL